MKIYRILVEYDLMVAAEDEDEAAQLGIENAEEALRDMCYQPDISVHEVASVIDIPKPWRGSYHTGIDESAAIQS